MPNTAQMARSHRLESAETQSRTKHGCQKGKKRINVVIPGDILPCSQTGALSSLHQRCCFSQQIGVDVETHRHYCGEKAEIANLHCDTQLGVRRIFLRGHVCEKEGSRKIIGIREDGGYQENNGLLNQLSLAHMGSEMEGAGTRSSWVCTRSSVDML